MLTKLYTKEEVEYLIYRAIRNLEDELEKPEIEISPINGRLSNRGQIAYNKILETMKKD